MSDDDGWKPLSGGTVSTVSRKGDVLRRARTPNSPAIQALLEHLEAQGFAHAPRSLGVDADYEYQTFVSGEPKSPFTWDGSDDRALVRAAEILRSYHDAVESFRWEGYEWMTYFHLSDRGQIITHNDFGIHNCIFVDDLPHAMVDFDEAAPGTREWDLAYTIYMFVPVHAHADFTDAPRKLRLLCDAYGLADRSTIIDTLVERVARSSEVARQLIDRGGAAADLGHQVLPFSKLSLEKLARERNRLQRALQ